jgi:hypothetical protein
MCLLRNAFVAWFLSSVWAKGMCQPDLCFVATTITSPSRVAIVVTSTACFFVASAHPSVIIIVVVIAAIAAIHAAIAAIHAVHLYCQPLRRPALYPTCAVPHHPLQSFCCSIPTSPCPSGARTALSSPLLPLLAAFRRLASFSLSSRHRACACAAPASYVARSLWRMCVAL